MRGRSASAIPILFALFIAASAEGQQRLGDVAGSIKIKKPEDGQAEISNTNIKRASRGPSLPDTPYGKCLAWKLEVFSGELRELAQMASKQEAIARILWREELYLQCDVIINLAGDFSSCSPDEAWQASAHQGLLDAVDGCRNAAVAVKNRGAGVDEQLAHFTLGLLYQVVPKFDDARQGLASIEVPRTEEEEPLRVKIPREIGEYCVARWPQSADLQRTCLNEQRNGYHSLMDRDATSVGVPFAVFDGIRSECLSKWGGDYASRDDCERERIRPYIQQRLGIK